MLQLKLNHVSERGPEHDDKVPSYDLEYQI